MAMFLDWFLATYQDLDNNYAMVWRQFWNVFVKNVYFDWHPDTHSEIKAFKEIQTSRRTFFKYIVFFLTWQTCLLRATFSNPVCCVTYRSARI